MGSNTRVGMFFLILAISLGIIVYGHGSVAASQDSENFVIVKKERNHNMKLKILIGKKVATAILYDNAASRDFASMLPLELHLDDYNRTEKISDLPQKLSTKDAPAGYAPKVGDITYYAPWGNMALFYKDFSYSSGLISLGKITSGIENFNAGGSLVVTIEIEK